MNSVGIMSKTSMYLVTEIYVEVSMLTLPH